MGESGFFPVEKLREVHKDEILKGTIRPFYKALKCLKKFIMLSMGKKFNVDFCWGNSRESEIFTTEENSKKLILLKRCRKK